MRSAIRELVFSLHEHGNADFVQYFPLPVGYILRGVGVKVFPLRRAGVSLRLRVDGVVTHAIDRDCARALEKLTTGKNKRGWFFLNDIFQPIARAAAIELEFVGVRWPAKVQIVIIEEWRK